MISILGAFRRLINELTCGIRVGLLMMTEGRPTSVKSFWLAATRHVPRGLIVSRRLLVCHGLLPAA